MATKRTKRSGLFKTGVATLTGGILLAVGSFAMAPAGAASVAPTQTALGNPTCQQLNPAWVNDFKIDAQPSNGVYNVSEADSGVVGGGTVTISNAGVVNGVFEFDWASTIAWDAVVVKQGDGAQYYDYTPGSTGDTDLTPSTQNQQPTGGISHLLFCRDNVDTTTTTTTEGTTTTTEGTTTTTVASTTTSETVLGTTVTKPDPTTSETVLGTTVNRLPRTGSGTTVLLLSASGLMALGLALVGTAKLREQRV